MFQLEHLNECKNEIAPILRNEHWEEVGHYRDIPIDMKWDTYDLLQKGNKLRCFTVRQVLNQEFNEHILAGYAFFIVDNHLHRKPYRGIGKEFLSWCDEQLKNEGVVTVTHHTKPWFNYGNLFEALGYEKSETIWSRRLK